MDFEAGPVELKAGLLEFEAGPLEFEAGPLEFEAVFRQLMSSFFFCQFESIFFNFLLVHVKFVFVCSGPARFLGGEVRFACLLFCLSSSVIYGRPWMVGHRRSMHG